jgi:hypothetical protein
VQARGMIAAKTLAVALIPNRTNIATFAMVREFCRKNTNPAQTTQDTRLKMGSERNMERFRAHTEASLVTEVLKLEVKLGQAIKERDEAQSELAQTRGWRDGCEDECQGLKDKLDAAIKERDEYRHKGELLCIDLGNKMMELYDERAISARLAEALKESLRHGLRHSEGCLYCGTSLDKVYDNRDQVLESHRKECWFYRSEDLLAEYEKGENEVKRLKVVKDNEWVQPVMRDYLMGCCDCGLVHRMTFRIIDGKHIQFKASRARNYTLKQRRLEKSR